MPLNTVNSAIASHADEKMLEALSRHKCVRCGACCRWRGQVYLYPDDIECMSRAMEMDRTEFLMGYCVIVYWPWAGSVQFRVALARKASGECVFLEKALCTVHAFKPLMCKAGPAAWPWIKSSKAFWFYVMQSPSFSHPPGTMPLAEANGWFMATREGEVTVGAANSVDSLAQIFGFPSAVFHALPLIEFKEEEEL